ncbi:hypothetical protein JCM11251_001312 [Rhodosporidiobolus azoricus]
MAAVVAAAPSSFDERHPISTANLDEQEERRKRVEREDDRVLDGLLQPYAFGATPTLELSFGPERLDFTAERRGNGANAGWIGDEAFAQAQNEREHHTRDGRSTPSYEPRPSLLHRPSSLTSRRSDSSAASSFVSVPPAPPRPYALPPGLAAHSPIPPSVSSGSTLRPGPSLNASATPTPQILSLPALPLVPVRGVQPRDARTAYEPPLPLDVQWLLLTTPPPPQRKNPPIVSAGATRREEQTAARMQLEKERAIEREKKDKERKEGLVKRLWAGKLLNSGMQQLLGVGGGGGNDVRRPQRMVPVEEEVEMATVKAFETLDLRKGRASGRRSGSIDSRSAIELVPKTWKEFEAMYAAGQLDVEDPPFPPLSLPTGISSTFPSRSQLSSLPSPYEAAHYPPPLHLSPITPIRERLLTHLDLLGERYLHLIAPAPPPTSALPALPHVSKPLSISTAVSPAPSAGSASSSAASIEGKRDSLMQFSSAGRRDSSASTAPSSALSHGQTAVAGKARPAGVSTVFPSRTLPTSVTSSTLHITAHGSGSAAPALSKSLSGSSMTAPSRAMFSMRNHPALVSLLIRALRAPLGSPALFNPPPKAAVITLFPSSQSASASAQLTILASLNIPAHVTSLPLQYALDGHVILNGERGLVVMDTERDWRWRGNELVRDGPEAEKTGGGLGIKFYAGMPVFAPSLPSLSAFEESAQGQRIAIGTVALLDDQPRLTKWGASERAKLRSLSSEISYEVERFLVDRDARASIIAQGRRGSAASSSGTSASPSAAGVLSASAPPSQHYRVPFPPSHPPHNPLPPSNRHSKKVSFDGNNGGAGDLTSRRSSVASSQPGGNGYVDWDAQLAAAGLPVAPPSVPPSAVAVPALSPPQEDPPAELKSSTSASQEADELPSLLPTTSLPPLLAASSPSQIYLSALTSLASTLSLQLVYLVALDLSSVPPAPSVEGGEKVKLSLVSAWNLPKGSQASFDPTLHLRALRAPEGGLLYRSPPSVGATGSKGKARKDEQREGGFASGVLLPVLESEKKGWVLAGYTTDRKRRWGEKEMDAFEKVREGVAKVVQWEEGGGWGGATRY